MIINHHPIAILLATYNAEKFLVEQLESILKQTDCRWSLYIRDDYSSDSTLEIIKSYCSKYPDSIFQLKQKTGNLGCRDNFFYLLSAVSSKYYMFCDQDDVWFTNKIEQSFKAIKQMEMDNPDTPILMFSDSVICDVNLNIISDSYWKYYMINPHKYLSYNLMGICCLASGACSIFNDKVKKFIFPVPDNNSMYDYLIALMVAKVGKIGVINETLRYYRLHTNQVSGLVKNEKLSWAYLKSIYSLASDAKKMGYGSIIKYVYYKLVSLVLKENTLFTKIFG